MDNKNSLFNCYLNLPYPVEVTVDKEEGGYVFSIPSLPGCITTSETFEEGVRLIDDAKKCWISACMEDCNFGISFGLAIEAAKKGHKIARRGWNGKNQYIELAHSISYVSPDLRVINCNHKCIGNKAFAFVGTSGVQMGWLASQADMLADDWYIVE